MVLNPCTAISCTASFLSFGASVFQAAEIRKERARWIEMEKSNALLQEELARWKHRFSQEAARSDELAADNAQLQSELLAARLEVFS